MGVVGCHWEGRNAFGSVGVCDEACMRVPLSLCVDGKSIRVNAAFASEEGGGATLNDAYSESHI